MKTQTGNAELPCDGNCTVLYGGHRGDVRKVHVEKWGSFNYCLNAIEEDIKRGLEVTDLTDNPSVTNR